MDVYLNGRMVQYERAQISHDDAGLQHGVGLFETMCAINGRVFRLDAHLNRLVSSARELGIDQNLDPEKLMQAVKQTVEHNRLDRARVRLTITAGRMSLLQGAPDSPPMRTTLVVATMPTQYDAACFEKGVTVQIGPPAANPFDFMAGYKTLAYWQRLCTLRQAAAAGAAEAIWLNISNHLASGAVSNLLLVKDGTLLTPFARGEQVEGALPAPVLPGITRNAVFELAAELDVPVQRRMLDVNDLLEADEVFLTNSSWHILPVTKVEKKDVANGKVGPITQRLLTALLALIDRETCSEES